MFSWGERHSLKYILALKKIKGLGIRRIQHLANFFNQPKEVFKSSLSQFSDINNIPSPVAKDILEFKDWESIQKTINVALREKIKCVTWFDSFYPDQLRHIPSPPLVLWYYGTLERLKFPNIAIVGTRNPTSYGKRLASRITQELACRSMTTISGFAFGIDITVHRTSVRYQKPTVAILGSGLLRIYPSEHMKDVEPIISNGGAVISELDLNSPPDAYNFPSRNRIISALCDSLVIVESPYQGGSLNTAQHALNQGKKIFCVPHSLENKLGQGGNLWIKKQQASMFLSVDNLLSDLHIHPIKKDIPDLQAEPSPRKVESELTLPQQKIYQLLKKDALNIDNMAETLGYNIPEFMVELFELELKGVIIRMPGQRFSLA